MWAKEDNEELANKIINEYKRENKLVIKHTDDILCSGIKYDFVEDTKYISDDGVNNICNAISDGNRAITITSPTGSGKSTILPKIIDFYFEEIMPKGGGEKIGDGCNILSLVSRRTMIGTLKNTLGKYNPTNYLESKYSNFHISSLENLAYYNGDIHYNILILDEINSLIKHFYSKTMAGKRLKCFNNFCSLVQRANLIIGCDANITNMVHKFIKQHKPLFGGVYRYKNINKNKKGVNMIVYRSVHKKEVDKLWSFCDLMKHDIHDKKSVLIFSDCKKVTIQLKNILNKKYGVDDKYVMLINKEFGTLQEIVDCNKTFKDKCVISSPKIIYGVDVLIEYNSIYCVYKYTANPNKMNALEYHQQYSRARKCKNVLILDMNSGYKTAYNKYVPFKQNKKMVKKLFNDFKSQHEKNCKDYNVINEMCAQLKFGNVEIDKDNVFASIHYYKTWYDKLFSYDKIQLVKHLAIEAGYEYSEKTLEITLQENNKNKMIPDAINNYKDKIDEICQKILDGEDISDKDKRMGDNVCENLLAKHRYLKGLNISVERMNELLRDDQKFIAFKSQKFLAMNRDEFNKEVIKINNSDIPQISQDSSIVKRIRAIEFMEDALNIKRFDIHKIEEKCRRKKYIENTKGKLSKGIDNLIVFYDDQRYTRSKKVIEKQLEKVKTPNDLQKWVADRYNKFGDIIGYIRKHKRIDGKSIFYYIFNKHNIENRQSNISNNIKEGSVNSDIIIYEHNDLLEYDKGI
jgi:hypothetical protein